MVRSQEFGPMAMGSKGVHFLKDGTIEGEDPLTVFGPRADIHLSRTDSFKYAPDILVNSFTILQLMKWLLLKSWWVVMVV